MKRDGVSMREGMSIEAQIAALADGTLADACTPEEAERLRERIEGAPDLSQALARQREALTIVDSLQEVRAPAELHASVQALVAEHARGREDGLRGLRRLLPHLPRPLPSRAPDRPARRTRPLMASGALAALLVALVLALAGQPASSPTVAQAARLALRPATLPSPSENAPHSHALDITIEGVAYPYWQGSLGWRAIGSRRDRLDGRTVTTVFYERAPGGGSAGARIGYAIVSGRSLSLPPGAVVVHRGLSFHVLAAQGATVVTWRRAGHTCILVARDVAASRLMDLASWQ